MKSSMSPSLVLVLALIAAPFALAARQSEAPGAYQPKFAGDKARSEAEFSALGFMRTVVSAEKAYHRKHNAYAGSLAALVGSVSFTRRMANPDRGDYHVAYKAKPDGYALLLIPRQFDAAHRSFYVDESGEFHGEQNRPATPDSPPLN